MGGEDGATRKGLFRPPTCSFANEARSSRGHAVAKQLAVGVLRRASQNCKPGYDGFADSGINIGLLTCRSTKSGHVRLFCMFFFRRAVVWYTDVGCEDGVGRQRQTVLIRVGKGRGQGWRLLSRKMTVQRCSLGRPWNLWHEGTGAQQCAVLR